MKHRILSIADGFYQLCGSSYHTLQRNVPVFAEGFTSDEGRHSIAPPLPNENML